MEHGHVRRDAGAHLAKRAVHPYNSDTKSGDEVYYDDDKNPIYTPNEGAYWPQKKGTLTAGRMLIDMEA